MLRERCVARRAPVAQCMPRARIDDERGPRIRDQPLGVGARGRRQRQVPAQQPFGDAQCGEKAEKTVEHVLAALRGDARVGEQPLQLAGPRTVEAELHGRRHAMRHQARAQRELHVQQRVEPPATQPSAQRAQGREAGALVHGDKLDALDETHETCFGLADDPAQLCRGPRLL